MSRSIAKQAVKPKPELQPEDAGLVPRHLGVIIDGNRRWAKKHGLPLYRGHQRGYRNVQEIGDACLKRGIKYLTIYAFSTENWSRGEQQVGYLINFARHVFTKHLQKLHKKGVRVLVIGQKERLPKDLLEAIYKAMELTKKNTKGTFIIAFNYGGRAELVTAIRHMVKDDLPANQITERTVAEYLYTAGVPDPDLIIRTSGEQRLSGFLTWQSAYSELYFTKTLWPDFTEVELDKALADYARRHRRFGR